MTSQKPIQHAEIKPGDTEQPAKTKPRISRLAIASLLLGILIFFPVYGPLFAIAAIITAYIAGRFIAKSRPKLRGTSLALAGIVLGILGVAFLTVIEDLQVRLIRKLPRAWVRPVANFTGMGMAVFGSFRGRLYSVRDDFRVIARALDAYYADHHSYPAWAKGESGINSFAGGHNGGAYHIHTFRIWKNDSEAGTFSTLTTPVPYLTHYFSDPWADTRGATYGYYADEHGWILYSCGPDTDENDIGFSDLEPDVEQVYRSIISQPSLTLVAGTNSVSHEAYTYDVTNGTISAGDIWRVRQ